MDQSEKDPDLDHMICDIKIGTDWIELGLLHDLENHTMTSWNQNVFAPEHVISSFDIYFVVNL